MSLRAQILNWDGKTASVLQEAYDAYSTRAGFSATLFDLLGNDCAQSGATWLLKAWLEQGNTPTGQQLTTFYNCLESLESLEHWSSRLHALQCLPYLEIPGKHRQTLENFLRRTLTETNKFVRAWSYHGFYELACQYPQYREEAEQFFTMALRDEPASVKARVRQIQKQGF